MITNIELTNTEEPKAYEIKHWGVGVHTEESIKNALRSSEALRLYVMYGNRNILIGYGSKATYNLRGGYIYNVESIQSTLDSLVKSLETAISPEAALKKVLPCSHHMFIGWWGDIFDMDIYEIIKSTKSTQKVPMTDNKLPDLII